MGTARWLSATLVVPVVALFVAASGAKGEVWADFAGADGGAATSSSPSWHGRILDAEGQVAPGASAALFDVASGREIDRVTTDDHGQFAFRRAPVAEARIVASDGLSGEVTSADLDPSGQSQSVTLVLEPKVVVRGTIVDDSGDPIGGAKARLALADATPSNGATSISLPVGKSPTGTSAVEIVLADEQGHFRFRSMPSARYQVTAWGQGFVPRTVAWPLASSFGSGDGSGSAGEARLVLKGYAAPRGVVVDPAGYPVAGATVVACAGSGRVTLTSATDGTFVASSHAVGCTAVAHHPLFATSAKVVLRAGQSVPLRLAKGGSIEGTVTDPSGRPLDGVTITVDTYRPSHGEPAASDGSWGEPRPTGSTFRIRGLAPGAYALKVVRSVTTGHVTVVQTAELSTVVVRAGVVTRGAHVVIGAGDDGSADVQPEGEGEPEPEVPAEEPEAPSPDDPENPPEGPSDPASGEPGDTSTSIDE